MPYARILNASEIVASAMKMIEEGSGEEGVSLRGVAGSLGVKAPSLYRYFPSKGSLEVAVAERALLEMHSVLEQAGGMHDPEIQLTRMAEAYLAFAKKRSRLYFFLMQDRLPDVYASQAGKAVWTTLSTVVSAVTMEADATASAVALWSFLHGYAALDRAGAFGASGPRAGLASGLDAFIHRSKRRRGTAERTKPAQGSLVADTQSD